jgi:hypothetical protein
MSNLAALTEAEVSELVNSWYQALDIHAPEVDMMRLISDSELEMRFPEATLRSQQEFGQWYQGVIRIFFDEVHVLNAQDIKLSPDGSYAEVNAKAYWEASRWKPPARYSERLKFDCQHLFKIKRSASTGKLCITLYGVEKLDPLPDSAPL